MKFVKMHGIGNDYVFADDMIKLSLETARLYNIGGGV